MNVLYAGRMQSVIDDVVRTLDAPDVHFTTANTLPEVQDILAAAHMDHVIIGGGLDLETRLQIVRHVFDTSDSTTVHMNSRSGGPASALPFVSSVVRAMADRPSSR